MVVVGGIALASMSTKPWKTHIKRMFLNLSKLDFKSKINKTTTSNKGDSITPFQVGWCISITDGATQRDLITRSDDHNDGDRINLLASLC